MAKDVAAQDLGASIKALERTNMINNAILSKDASIRWKVIENTKRTPWLHRPGWDIGLHNIIIDVQGYIYEDAIQNLMETNIEHYTKTKTPSPNATQRSPYHIWSRWFNFIGANINLQDKYHK